MSSDHNAAPGLGAGHVRARARGANGAGASGSPAAPPSGSHPTRAEASIRPTSDRDASPSTITTGAIRRVLLLLALPVLTEQMLNAFVSIFDTFLAGRISASATNAIGLAAYVTWLASMLFALVGTGTTALVARMSGAGDRRQASHIANQSVFLAVIIGLGTAALLFVLAPWFATMQAMTGETRVIAIQYLRFSAVGEAVTSLTLVGGAALRGAGDMRTPMLIQGLINVVNVIASPCFVYGIGPFPALGVVGIVSGTIVAQVLGAILMTAILFRGRAGIRLKPADMKPTASSVWRILRIGGPAAADGAIMWSGHFLFLMVIARLASGAVGEAFYAAHIVAVRVEAFTYLPAVAWGTAAATMIGQALGAGDRARAVRSGHEAVLQCGLLSSTVAAFFYLGAETIFAVMHVDPLVHNAGVAPFRVLALLQPILGLSIVYIHAMRGAGDTRFPLLITIIGIIVVRLPIGFTFGILLSGGLMGAWMGMCADMTWRGTAAWLRYRSAKWADTAV